MKKKTILTVVSILFIPAIIFALFGFTLWDFNPANMTESNRGAVSCIWFVLVYAYYLFLYNNRITREDNEIINKSEK